MTLAFVTGSVVLAAGQVWGPPALATIGVAGLAVARWSPGPERGRRAVTPPLHALPRGVPAMMLAFVTGSAVLAAVTAFVQFWGPPVRWSRGTGRARPAYWPRGWRVARNMVVSAFGALYPLHAMMPGIAPDRRFHLLYTLSRAGFRP